MALAMSRPWETSEDWRLLAAQARAGDLRAVLGLQGNKQGGHSDSDTYRKTFVVHENNVYNDAADEHNTH